MNQLWQEVKKDLSKQQEELSQENDRCVQAAVGKFIGMMKNKEKGGTEISSEN